MQVAVLRPSQMKQKWQLYLETGHLENAGELHEQQQQHFEQHIPVEVSRAGDVQVAGELRGLEMGFASCPI